MKIPHHSDDPDLQACYEESYRVGWKRTAFPLSAGLVISALTLVLVVAIRVLT